MDAAERKKYLDQYVFTGQLSSGYQFSVDPRNVAATLREMADRIESGDFL
jgi:hypothetical protein